MGPLKGVRRLIGELTGSVERELVTHLAGQVAAAREGTLLAKEAAVGGSDRAELGQRMAAAEHAGDDQRAKLVETLSTALMTPFDREDLFRVSRSIDDVLDNLQDFVRELSLFEVADERFARILDAVDGCLAELDTAVTGIRESGDAVVSHALGASKASAQVRERYQDGLADLFTADEVTTGLLKRRELLRRLDVVGLRLGEAADALADGAVKRG